MKAINDLVRPDNIILTLLVFGAYPRISNNSLLSLMSTKKTKTIRKTNNKIRKYYTKRHVEDVFRIRNNPDIIAILKLLI
jgi:Zn/Cd-binding protein ZinT